MEEQRWERGEVDFKRSYIVLLRLGQNVESVRMLVIISLSCILAHKMHDVHKTV